MEIEYLWVVNLIKRNERNSFKEEEKEKPVSTNFECCIEYAVLHKKFHEFFVFIELLSLDLLSLVHSLIFA